jgi:N-acetylmuramoyl-L-alanine amidase
VRSKPPYGQVVGVLVLAVALAVLRATPAAAAEDLLRRGAEGPAVADWQRRLNDVRGPDVVVDGRFGPATEGATRDLQRAAGVAVDGVVGPETRAALTRTAPPAEAVQLRHGDRGPEVRALQERLAALGYWLGPADGAYGELTRQAVLAFQKVNRLDPDAVAGPATRAALEHAAAPRPRSSSGVVLEVDLAAQVLLDVQDGVVRHVWNTSTGTGLPYAAGGADDVADTPPGRYAVTHMLDGWRTSDLGELYRPAYFHPDGIAVHGHPDVPAAPASHGCVRVSLQAMDFLAPRLRVGTPIWVY